MEVREWREACAASLVCLVTSLSAIAAEAQTPVVPSTVESRGIVAEPRQPAPDRLEIAGSGDISQPAAPPNASALKFVLRELIVEGRTAIPENQLQSAYKSRLGQEISVADLYTIAGEITRVYRARGYFLSVATVPPQTIEDGRAAIRVVEGSIGEVEVRGKVADRRSLAERTARVLAQSGPASAGALERQLLLINDLPDFVARGTLVPSERGLGFAKLLVDVEQDRFRIDLEGDNRGGAYLGPERYRARLTLNSLLGMQGATVIDYGTASPTSKFSSLGISHTAHLGISGATLRVSYNDVSSEPDLSSGFAGFSLQTDSKSASADISYPLLRSRQTNLNIRGGVRYFQGETLSDFLTVPTEDTLSSIRLGLGVDHADGFHGITTFDVEASKGMTFLGASRRGDPGLSRSGGDPAAGKATVYLARLQSLGGRFSLLFAVNGQYAFSNLLAPDEFAFGGEYFGRAFDGAELVGDSGASGKVELRWDLAIGQSVGLMPYAFYEGGWVSRRLGPDDVGFVPEEESALSAGAGIRMTFGRYVSGFLEAAKPVNRDVAAEGNRDTRVFGGLKVSF